MNKVFTISILTLLLFIALLTFIQSCKKLEFERVIRVKTGVVSNTTSNSATITGVIQDVGENGITQHGHCWSLFGNPIYDLDTKTGLGIRVNTGSFDSELTGLTANTTYNIRAYAMSDGQVFYGDNMTFTTNAPDLPAVSTASISNITDNSAASGGNIASDGGSTVTVRGVCWSITQNPTVSDDYTTDGSGTGSFVSDISGLSSSTKYYVRAYATNSAGTGYGNELNFTTVSIIEWQRSLGGTDIDMGYSIQQTTDDGYIVVGGAMSDNGNLTENKGDFDAWVVKLTSSGELDWQKSIGGSGYDMANSVQQTSDGGYIIAGASESDDFDVSGNHGNKDYWIVKLTPEGDIDWQKSLGGSDEEIAYSCQQTSDGGYIVAGYSKSGNGDVSGNNGAEDCWIVKLDTAGNIDWQKSFGGSENDLASSIQQTIDGGYIISGVTNSEDGDVTGDPEMRDYWIVKIDTTGEIEWQKLFGGTSVDETTSIRQTADGNYIIAGYTSSSDGDISEYKGTFDYWIVKITSTGDIDWQKTLGGSGIDRPASIEQTSDGGYIVAGYSASVDDDVSGNHGAYDYWIVKLTSIGGIVWQKSFGGSLDDKPSAIQQTSDGGYIVAGLSNSGDGDVMGNHGGYDYWIIKIPGE